MDYDWLRVRSLWSGAYTLQCECTGSHDTVNTQCCLSWPAGGLVHSVVYSIMAKFMEFKGRSLVHKDMYIYRYIIHTVIL